MHLNQQDSTGNQVNNLDPLLYKIITDLLFEKLNPLFLFLPIQLKSVASIIVLDSSDFYCGGKNG